MRDLFNKLLILRTPGIGPAKYAELIAKFGDADRAAQSLTHDDSFKDSVCKEMETADRLNIKYLCDDDELYPASLRAIRNHPPVLTVRGNMQVFAKQSVAIVGTRHATGAGLRFVSDMAKSFADHNHVVVSGIAMGTDAAAHKGALLSSGESQTIAVLAGGVDYIWPLENESLYYKIIERGAVISEMPVGFQPNRSSFALRNRWIAGLCDRMVLGEADLKSGSMATARFAIEYGRPVYAIPSHPSDPRAAGPNSLIRDKKAIICLGAQDFFETDKKTSRTDTTNNKSPMENSLIDKLGIIPVSESVLAELVKKSVAEIKRDLVVLELQGLVAKVDGGYIQI
ncbi:MAG: DNA-processing protein DprA [Rickettsiales bacterium]|jgi:DNA processing protein|nr:DNA-processing protein DprA [Rickettsiales bacterium]